MTEFTPLTLAFLDRAIAADSVGVAVLATDSVSVQRILAMQRAAPGQLREVRQTLRLSSGVREGSRALVHYDTQATFRPPYLERRGAVQAQFTREGNAWRVEYLAPPPC